MRPHRLGWADGQSSLALSLTRSPTHPLVPLLPHSTTHSLTHSLTKPLTHPLARSLTPARSPSLHHHPISHDRCALTATSIRNGMPELDSYRNKGGHLLFFSPDQQTFGESRLELMRQESSPGHLFKVPNSVPGTNVTTPRSRNTAKLIRELIWSRNGLRNGVWA